MYSIHNEGNVIAKRFITTLKNKIFEFMVSVSKNVYIDKLDEIDNEYNNTYHSTIKMKPVDARSNTYINSSKEINDKNPKCKVGCNVEYQNIRMFLQNVTLQIGQKKFLSLKSEQNCSLDICY